MLQAADMGALAAAAGGFGADHTATPEGPQSFPFCTGVSDTV